MKVFNVKGIIILVVILLVIQLGVGLIISPILSAAIIKNINKAAGTKISVGSVNVWPLTLSCSLKDLKVFDPDDEKQRMAWIKKASLRISPLRLLSKQLVISKVSVSGAEIDIKTEPDGSFNIQKLAPKEPGKTPAKKAGIFDKFKGKQDWFSRIYQMIKNKSSKEAVEEKKAEEKETKKVTQEVQQLLKGRRVLFKTLSDDYIFQIRSFVIKDSSLKLETSDKQEVSIEKAVIVIKNLGIDPLKGARFDNLVIKGNVNKGGKPAGNFNLSYAQSFVRGNQKTVIDLSARNIDLTAVSFIYEDSLPVSFTKGQISINSDTDINNGSINSSNSITLKDHNVVPKSGQRVALGIIPLPAVCDALNKVDPLKMKFEVTGTLDKPQFKGFQDVLMKVLKPYLTDVVTGDLKEKGTKALQGLLGKTAEGSAEGSAASGGDTASKAVDSIKSLFGEKK